MFQITIREHRNHAICRKYEQLERKPGVFFHDDLIVFIYYVYKDRRKTDESKAKLLRQDSR